jgi:hypothetical protein
MYHLPLDFDERQLLGHILEMVCIGPYFTRLNFSRPHHPGSVQKDKAIGSMSE